MQQNYSDMCFVLCVMHLCVISDRLIYNVTIYIRSNVMVAWAV